MESEVKDLKSILIENNPIEQPHHQLPQRQLLPHEWVEIRLFISSSFIDTHSERNVLVKRVIPDLNRHLKQNCIRITPVDLRWGVLKEESKDCYAIQATCLNEIDNCRLSKSTYPYFIGIRTQRYGWVQDKLLKSNEFENPDLFNWVKALVEYEKDVSITSLECIHAVWPVRDIPPASTLFFYEREIKNPKDIEEHLTWIFDFEHRTKCEKLNANVENQYNRTDKADIYKNDKDSLDDYLRTQDHVLYRKYSCYYEKGGAHITGSTVKRKFGIGKVKGLEDFEKIVREDLLNAIQKNFKPADISKIPKHVLKNKPYEEATKEKASTFVGRPGYTDKIFSHCTRKHVENSVMIVNGVPGRGKSALVAYVANKCMEKLLPNNHFVFMHGVDTCPQSNDLEQMLIRLHENISAHIGTTNTMLSAEDLKSKHVSQLEEIASNHPEQLFVIFVDAVNQFHEEMRAFNMWWLPSENAPTNLRFIISTLVKENKTYENALARCPGAEVLSIENMTRDESENMVASLLSKFNKKLTTDDKDKFLKNQMSLLVSKNTSPLFLSAACEALRTQGVYETITTYIENLPETVPGLFQYLLDGWSKDYGDEFIQYLTCILTLSRDGLLENLICDILSYIEKTKCLKFDCSVSTVFASVRGFLSSGGGGNLRFFHDQLHQVVRGMYLTPVFEAEVHELLSGFYLEIIQPQLSEEPTRQPLMYYEESLRHVVYHQIAARKLIKRAGDFSLTLRNIFFIREIVYADQADTLQRQYLNALKYESDKDMTTTLQQWRKFANLYVPFIKEVPQWSYNMAVNQIQSNHVYVDTMNLNVSATHYEKFPTYWVNKPPNEETDYVLLRYTSMWCRRCASTTVEANMVAVSEAQPSDVPFVFVYDMSTAELIHKIPLKHFITSLNFSNDHKYLWVGDSEGFAHACDLITGRVVWTSARRIGGKGETIWLQHINENIVCGTGYMDEGFDFEGGDIDDRESSLSDGTVEFICPTTKCITKSWSTGEGCFVYHYHNTKQWLLTGHTKGVKGWSMGGDLVKNIELKGKVCSLDVHPSKEDVLVCGLKYFGSVVLLNIINGEVMWKSRERSPREYDVLHTHSGDKLVCGSRKGNGLLLLDGEGKITNHVKGYSNLIRNLKKVPGTNNLLVAGWDGLQLFNLPKAPDQHIDEGTCGIRSCTSLINTNNFIIWEGRVCKAIKSIHVKGDPGVGKVVAHPLKDDIIVVRTERDLLIFNSITLSLIVSHNVVGEGEDDRIYDVTISGDGNTCIVAKHSACISILFDITDPRNITTITTFKLKGPLERSDRMNSADIHNDGKKVVCGSSRSSVLYDVASSQPIVTLREGKAYYVRFLYHPECVLIVDFPRHIHTVTLDGVPLLTFPGQHYDRSPIIINDTFLLTGGFADFTINLMDIRSGEMIYKFFHPSSQTFTCFVYQPEHNKLFACNQNGHVYILEARPPL